jgi:Cupin
VDIVGQIVTAVRTGRPIAGLTDLYGTWGLRFRGDQGAGFHVLLQGSAWIVPPIVSAPVKLGVGDVVFVGKADGYTLADHPDTQLQDVDSIAPKEQWPIPVPRPGERPDTVLLCGTYALELARPHPLIAQLPRVIHLPARATIGEPVRSVVPRCSATAQVSARPCRPFWICSSSTRCERGMHAKPSGARRAGRVRCRAARCRPRWKTSNNPRPRRGRWPNSPQRVGYPGRRLPATSAHSSASPR